MTEDELIARVKAHRARERAALRARVQVWECDGGAESAGDDIPALPGDAALRAFPDSFDNRQRPKCGYWNEYLGPCICGDPSRHQETP